MKTKRMTGRLVLPKPEVPRLKKGECPVWLRKLCLIMVFLIVLVAVGMALSGCVRYNNGQGKTFTAVGMDASLIEVHGEMTIKDANMSKSIEHVTKLVQKMWNSYLLQQGLEFLGGKYYDLKGKEVASSEAVKLEELRNANSVEMANIKLKELEMMHAAAPLP